MSYLFLDGYFTGVKYGTGIDYAALIKAAMIGRVLGSDRLHLGFGDRGAQAAEHLVMTRYWNFRSIYWHHTNRAFMAMILAVVRSLYIDKKLSAEGYLRDTLWCSDVQALQYLDNKYRELFYHKPSLLHELPFDRGGV